MTGETGIALREGANNFTLLRNAFAFAVVIGHFYYLAVPAAIREAAPATFPWADLGVEAFFVTSGVLVAASFAGEPRVVPFWIRRVFRIAPLYLAVVLAQALAMSAILSADGRFSAAELVRYLAANAVFLNFSAPDMGGLFADFATPAINPSLWTLKIELMFYLALPTLHFVFVRVGWAWIAALFLASTAFYLWFADAHPEIARQLPGQMRYFAVGMAIAHGLKVLGAIPRPSPLAAAALALGLLALAVLGRQNDPTLLQVALQPVVIGAFVFVAAFWLPLARRTPDLSYGLYLIHAPIIQLTLLFGAHSATLLGLAAVTAASALLAVAGRLAIEKPMIRLGRVLASKSVLRGASAPAPQPAPAATGDRAT